MVSTQNKQMARKSIKNSTVLVVGATGVLGMEVCRQLAAAGPNTRGVALNSRYADYQQLHLITNSRSRPTSDSPLLR